MTFLGAFLDVPPATLWFKTSIFGKWETLRWYIYQASFIDNGFSVAKFWIVILGWFYMFFLTRTPQMWSHLFEILQCKIIHQICHGYYCSLKKWSKLSPKILRGFFVYALLHPYTPSFKQMKGFIKIRNRCQFHQYSACGFQVINFQKNFLYWFNSPFLGGRGEFMGPYSPKCGWIMLNFSPELFSKNTKVLLYKFFRINHSGLNGACTKFTILVYFGAQFTLGKP